MKVNIKKKTQDITSVIPKLQQMPALYIQLLTPLDLTPTEKSLNKIIAPLVIPNICVQAHTHTHLQAHTQST